MKRKHATSDNRITIAARTAHQQAVKKYLPDVSYHVSYDGLGTELAAGKIDYLILDMESLTAFAGKNPFYDPKGNPLLSREQFQKIKAILCYVSAPNDPSIDFELDKIKGTLTLAYDGTGHTAYPAVHFLEITQLFNQPADITNNLYHNDDFGEFLFYLVTQLVDTMERNNSKIANTFFRPSNIEFARYLKTLNAIGARDTRMLGFKIASVSYFGRLNNREHYLVDAPFKHYYEDYGKDKGLNDIIGKFDLYKFYYCDFDEKKPYVDSSWIHVYYQVLLVNDKPALVIRDYKLSGGTEVPAHILDRLVKGWVRIFHVAVYYAGQTMLHCSVHMLSELPELSSIPETPGLEVYFLLKRVQDNFNFDGLVNTIFYRENTGKTSPDLEKSDIKHTLADFYYSFLIPKALEVIMPIYSEELKAALLKTAVISILVDSYAHNISAHSMVALEEWFRQRSELLEKKIYINNNSQEIQFGARTIPAAILKEISKSSSEFYSILGLDDQTNTDQFVSLADIIRLKGVKIGEYFTGYSYALDDKEGPGQVKTGRPAPLKYNKEQKVSQTHEFPVPVDYALWQFFRFLKGKAAFWSGVTRDLPFGGEHLSLYDLLYKHLSENPLYLGTIGHTEGINKLNIKIGLDIGFGMPDQQQVIQFYDFIQINTALIQKDQENPEYPSDGSELTRFHPARVINGEKTEEIDYSEYGFIRLGRDFRKLRKTLEKAKNVFIPGGLIGIHSFLTIIENTIRNVKHYKHHIQAGDNLRKNGLTLLLTLEQMDLFNKKFDPNTPNGNNHRLYRIGVALGHTLASSDRNIQQSISNRLFDDIVDMHSRAPRLGGTSQDKVCSAMLLNNRFMSVESVSTPRDFFYYPWIHPKQISLLELNKGKTLDPLLSENILQEACSGTARLSKKRKQQLSAAFLEKTEGTYVFKFFNLWASDEIVYLDKQTGQDEVIAAAENYTRFKFGVLPAEGLSPYLAKIIKRTAERQIFRLIESDNPNLSLIEAYKIWNRSIFHTGDKLVSTVFDNPNGTFLFAFTREGEKSSRGIQEKFTPPLRQGQIVLAHGNNEAPDIICNYRSHGRLVEYFSENKRDITGKIARETFPEFIETILFRIKIWDDRIFERMRGLPLEKYKLGFNLSFYPEDHTRLAELELAEDEKHTIFIVHLSYIESLKNNYPQMGKTGENLINWFIETCLRRIPDLREFTLTIISGRGNADWFEGVNPAYLPFLIYRPVESLIDAIEDAVVYGDDFQLKYNICKTIIGS